MGKFSTKDLELSEKLQAKECTVKNITRDPTDQMLIHTFHETEKEISKIKTELEKETVQEKAEALPEVKKKVGRKKKRR